jgi:uncharacterized protein (TIRG00374 family)
MKWPRILLWLPIPVLLYLAAREVEWSRAVALFARWSWWQIGVLTCVNGFFFGMLSYRWFFILRRAGCAVRFPTVTRARLVGFAVSYLTPGPQIGGEPAQVRYLTRRTGEPVEAVVSSVLLDRLVEMIGNFGFLCIGLAVLASSQLWDASHSWAPLAVPLGVALVPVAYLAGLFRGWTPIAVALGWIGRRRPRFSKHRLVRKVGFAERELVSGIRRDPRMVFVPMAMHAVLLAVSLADTAIVLSVLGLPLGLAEIVIILTASRLAFLLPIPGGLGSLEASQVAAFALLGFEPAYAVGLTLYIRVRDIFVAVAGLTSLRGMVVTRQSLGSTAETPYHGDDNAEEHGR